MHNPDREYINNNNIDINSPLAVSRITALWAFSEAALGGIMHALKIPLTGILISGAAVIFISLIAQFSIKKNAILKSLLIVLIVKGIVSPHSPFTAYLAVSLQGLLGFLIFSTIRFKKAAALILAILSLLYSGTQRIIIITVVFGNTFWESIDAFAEFIRNKFFPSYADYQMLKFSFLIIAGYLVIHLIAGIIIGIAAGRISHKFSVDIPRLEIKKYSKINDRELIAPDINKNRKRWWKKRSRIILLTSAIILMVLSFMFPELGSSRAYSILIMIVRAVIITVLWFTLISPLFLKLFRKIFSKRQSAYADEIENVINIFPQMLAIIKQGWRTSSSEKGINKYKSFITTSIALVLLSNFNPD